MALWRWFSHYSIAWCFLLLEEHNVDRRLKFLRDVDAFSLSVGNEVTATARIRYLVWLFLHVDSLRRHIFLLTLFEIMGIMILRIIDLQFLERHFQSLLLFLLLRKAFTDGLSEMIDKSLGALVFCPKIRVFFLSRLGFWFSCECNGIAVELKKHFVLFWISYSNSS